MAKLGKKIFSKSVCFGEDNMVTKTTFQLELESIFEFAERKQITAILVKAGNLHRLVTGYPNRNHRMPLCCRVMREYLLQGDEILSEPSSGEGASLLIKYNFPRN